MLNSNLACPCSNIINTCIGVTVGEKKPQKWKLEKFCDYPPAREIWKGLEKQGIGKLIAMAVLWKSTYSGQGEQCNFRKDNSCTVFITLLKVADKEDNPQHD